VYGLFQGLTNGPAGRGQVVRLVLFFGVASFMAWSPFDFWSVLPHLLSFVQFSLPPADVRGAVRVAAGRLRPGSGL